MTLSASSYLYVNGAAFLFQNSEIYGGIQGFYDYGPVGAPMKYNWKNLWWRDNVTRRRDVVGIDGTIITHPTVWQASGHVKNFADVMVECKSCHHRFRPDLIGNATKCPDCGGEFTQGRKYNILFETNVGVIEGEKLHTYLRGEACQTIYLDFKNIVDSTRVKIPFGIAQIGKAFRNENYPQKTSFTVPVNSNSGMSNILSIPPKWTNGTNIGKKIG